MPTFTNDVMSEPATNGIEGLSKDGRGVIGSSVTNYGVLAHSTESAGIKGSSDKGRGVEGWATDNEGVVGYTDGRGTGVWGQAAGTGVGVLGTSKSGTGVIGVSDAPDGVGVLGRGRTAGRFEGNVVVTGTLSVNGMSLAYQIQQLEAYIKQLKEMRQGDAAVGPVWGLGNIVRDFEQRLQKLETK